MAEIIIMPKLGFNMDEGKLVKWCISVGDSIKKGEVLFEIETDKTTMQVEATRDGVLLQTMLEEGDFAPVFTHIAVVGDAGEDPATAVAADEGGYDGGAESAPAAEAGAPATAPANVPAVAKTDLLLTPKAQKLVKDEGIALESLVGVKGTGFRGGITAKDIKASESIIKASPLARKAAELAGVDLTAVSGSGVGGKIMKADVETAPMSAPAAADGERQILSTAPYKGVRKIIGDRLSESKRSAPHVYFTDSIDTSKLSAFRQKINEEGDVKVAVSDLLILAAGKALQQYPSVNVSLVNDQIVTYKSVNVGIAVAGDNGLIVPVVKNVQNKSLTAIAGETRDFVERAKVGKLAPAEYSGGTFTVSNLGMFGIENFTAVINPPEAAILSVSSVRKKAVVVTDENGEDVIAIRPMMNVQLTVDHRLIDGLLAAQFVSYFKKLLENPMKILL